ncbi:hypothetical protein V6x_17460 [Gimesia chilikensis]|uniref:Uncharacterized protein n=1 Tax=Gimesia chilikensis TaxID=2605989 RepID=A0A517W9X2_9PLAN|nr:hypothetical protein V6x_17460 [Gimesia chilikensis]
MPSNSVETDRQRKSKWPRLILCVVIVVLGLRLVIIVSGSPSGWHSLWHDWKAEVWRLLGQTTSVSEELPEKQAQYWLQQVEQIPTTRTDAQVALGAAWMLSEPQYGYLKRDILSTKDAKALSENLFELRNRAEAEYQTLCRAACLKQAAIATQLAPEDVDFWRQRALLLFVLSDESEWEPSTEDWLSLLDECAAHDRENALYDYLAAIRFYQQSAEPVWDDDYRLTLKITNPPIYAQAEQRLEAGQKKSTLDVGAITWSATLAFLEKTSLPREEQIKATEGRNAIYPAEMIVIRLLRWLDNACKSDLRQKKYAAVIRNADRELRIAEQLTGRDNLYELTIFKYSFRTLGLGHSFQVLQTHPESFTPEEAAKLKQDLHQAWLQRKLFMEALNRYHAQQDAQPAIETAFATTLTELSQPFILLLFLLSLLLVLTARWSGWHETDTASRPGWWKILIAWLSGVSLSLFLWGVIPAGVLPERVWNILLLIVGWVSLILILTSSLRMIRKRGNITCIPLISLLLVLLVPVLIGFQYRSLQTSVEDYWLHASLALFIPVSLLLFVCYGAAIFIVIHFLCSPGRSARRKLTVCGLVFLVTLLIVPVGSMVVRSTLNPAEMQTWFGGDISVADENPFLALATRNRQSQKQIPTWIWIYPQWTSHHGEGLAILLSLSILLSWSLLRRSRLSNASDSPIWQKGVLLLRRSSLVALLVVTMVYLAALPSVIKAENKDYQKRSQVLLDLLQPLQEVDRIQTEIKGEPEQMQSIELQIKEIEQQLIEEADQTVNPSPQGEFEPRE